MRRRKGRPKSLACSAYVPYDGLDDGPFCPFLTPVHTSQTLGPVGQAIPTSIRCPTCGPETDSICLASGIPMRWSDDP
jgi:hypothetical protein